MNVSIKNDIDRYWKTFFDKLKSFILEEWTCPTPYDATIHETNKSKLQNVINDMCNDCLFNKDISYDALWEQMYTKVFYSWTRAEKASKEIESIKQHGVFDDFRDLQSPAWNFDKSEWKEFTNYWKKEVGNKANWLQLAKKSPHWYQSRKSTFTNTWESTLILMTKSERLSDVKFSALDAKMEKYIKIARFLCSLEKSKKYNTVLDYFTWWDYNFEDEKFWGIHDKFAGLLWDITALHLMMDLWFKTVKPDRVLTYLFVKLWRSEIFSKDTVKEVIMNKYQERRVWEDVIEKALYLERLLWGDYKNSLRALDIWIVKYGQEPDENFWLTKNLEKKYPIEKLFEQVKQA